MIDTGAVMGVEPFHPSLETRLAEMSKRDLRDIIGAAHLARERGVAMRSLRDQLKVYAAVEGKVWPEVLIFTCSDFRCVQFVICISDDEKVITGYRNPAITNSFIGCAIEEILEELRGNSILSGQLEDPEYD